MFLPDLPPALRRQPERLLPGKLLAGAREPLEWLCPCLGMKQSETFFFVMITSWQR